MKEMKTIDPLDHALASLREWTRSAEPIHPAPSPRPFLGPLITTAEKTGRASKVLTKAKIS